MANIERPKTPLDETLWRDQAWYRTWGPLAEHTVMDYFRLSTFFDPTSNNGTLFAQMQFRPEIRAELSTPDLFNARLRRMTGVEYMLATGSAETGVWVIRKQIRRGVRVDENGREVEDLTVVATYYVVGENVFAAPAVGAVLAGRMLTAITALRKAQGIAAGIAEYSPAGPPARKDQDGGKESGAGELVKTLAMQRRFREEYLEDHAPLLGDPGSFLSSQGSQASQVGREGVSRGGTPAIGAGAGTGKK